MTAAMWLCYLADLGKCNLQLPMADWWNFLSLWSSHTLWSYLIILLEARGLFAEHSARWIYAAMLSFSSYPAWPCQCVKCSASNRKLAFGTSFEQLSAGYYYIPVFPNPVRMVPLSVHVFAPTESWEGATLWTVWGSPNTRLGNAAVFNFFLASCSMKASHALCIYLYIIYNLMLPCCPHLSYGMTICLWQDLCLLQIQQQVMTR